MELLILAVVAFGFYKMNKKSNEYKQLADEAQTKLDTYVKANQSADKKYDDVLRALKVYNGLGEEEDYYHE